MNNGKKHVFILLLIITAAVLWWFKAGLILVPSETCYLIKPSSNLMNYLYAWDSTCLSGYPILQMAGFVFPFKAFFALLEFIGLPLLIAQVLYYILTLGLAVLSMYWLIRSLIRERADLEMAPLISAIFYIFNPFLLVHIMNVAFLTVFSILPLTLYLWMKGLESIRGWLKYSVLLGLCAVYLSTCTINFPQLGGLFIILGAYFIYFILLLKRNQFLHSLKFAIATSIITFLLCLYWLIPIFTVSFTNALTPLSQDSVGGWHQRGASSILDAFRLLGFWWWSNMPFAKTYANPFMILTTLCVPLFSFSVILYRNLNRKILFFPLIGVIGIFLVKASHPPLDFVYDWLTEHVYGFWVFREPYAKFSLITLFSYSVTLGIGLEMFYLKLKKASPRNDSGVGRRSIFLAGSILLVFINTWPLTIGNAFPTYRVWSKISPLAKEITPSHNAFMKVPAYYRESAQWLGSQQDDFRLFLTPMHRGGVYLKWGLGYSGVTPEQFLFNKPVLIPSSLGVGLPYIPGLISSLFTYRGEYTSQFFKITNISKFLGLMNVKYIEQRDDFGPEFLLAGITPRQTPKYMESVLSSNKDIVLERRFGRLKFYRNRFFLPRVYLDSSPVLINDNVSILPLFLQTGYLGTPRSLFFSDLQGQAPAPSGDEGVKDIVVTAAASDRGDAGIDYFFYGKLDWLVEPYTREGRLDNDFDIAETGDYMIEVIVEPDGDSVLQQNLAPVRLDGKLLTFAEFGRTGYKTYLIYSRKIPLSSGRHRIEAAKNGSFSVKAISIRREKDGRGGIKSVKFHKKNPTRYIVELGPGDTTGPFWLVLGETFHSGWEAYIRESPAGKGTFSNDFADLLGLNINKKNRYYREIKNHFLINGYANSWWVSQDDLKFIREKQAYEITLEYTPERIHALGLLVSGLALALALSIIYLIVRKR